MPKEQVRKRLDDTSEQTRLTMHSDSNSQGNKSRTRSGGGGGGRQSEKLKEGQASRKPSIHWSDKHTQTRSPCFVFYLIHTHTGHLHRNSHTHRVTFTLSHTDINILEERKNHLTTHLPLKMNILFPLFNCQGFTQYLLYTQYYTLSLSHTHTRTHTRTCKYTLTHTHSCTHARTHACTHTHTHMPNEYHNNN